jgi:16S rRNA (guanine527-N7)-methyltransferase
MEIIHFLPGYVLSKLQIRQFDALEPLYQEWNSRINVISRKDIDNFFIRHLLHSLSIARLISFKPGTSVMDAGTGGGFPGIPLAILFPEVRFTLTDSIAKKIRVVDAIVKELGLENVTTSVTRYETIRERYDFVTGRAVSDIEVFYSVLRQNIKKEGINSLKTGVLYLTGGDLSDTLARLKANSQVWSLDQFFPDPWFATKKLVHLYP